MARGVFKKYYSLTKPGVLYGNALTAAAGFGLASSYFGRFDGWLFISSFFGTSLVIASACALNNLLDQDIDSKMARTKQRVSVTQGVSNAAMAVFSAVLGLVGFGLLIWQTNWLVVLIGAVGYIVYVVLYGMLSKRLSIHGTLVGSISGAAPILAGYCAVSGQIDTAAILAFSAVFLWQMPEFYSISIFRRSEYKSAGVPVMAVVKGIKNTKIQIFIYVLAFIIVSLLFTAFGITGYTYFIVMALLSVYWLKLGLDGLQRVDNEAWARQMFRFSLIMILGLCLMLPIGPLLI